MAVNGRNSDDLEKQRLLLVHADHEEKHFTSSEVVRDIIIGVSDGLTVPFALAAGLSGADVSSSIILVAGIAEVAAGAISMGLGGYVCICTLLYSYVTSSPHPKLLHASSQSQFTNQPTIRQVLLSYPLCGCRLGGINPK